MHNGKASSGIASPRFQHGRYSKDIPAHLSQRYLEARNDPDLLSLRDEIAAMEARLGELFGRLSTGESRTRMEQLSAVHGSLLQFLHDSESSELLVRLGGIVSELGDVLSAADSDSSIWTEIDQGMMSRARLIDAEQRRLVAMQQFMTAEQAMTYSAAVAGCVKRRADEHMSDELERRAFLRDVANDMRAFADHDGRAEIA